MIGAGSVGLAHLHFKAAGVAEVDGQYRVEFANKPGVTYERFIDSWGQDDPEKYIQDFNRRSARKVG